MADSPEPYYTRFWKRFFKDAAAWARDNILWGIAVLIIPPLLIYLRDRQHAAVDWPLIRAALIFYAVTLAIYALVHICRVPKKLDDARTATDQALQSAIQQQTETIRALREKPKYTPAEQHDYDTARKALKQYGKTAITALRHLRTGPMVFGTFNPVLPSRLNRDEVIGVYTACADEGIVRRELNVPQSGI